MIDIENQIITAVMDALGESVDVKSDLTQIPSFFPCVYVVEADNYTYTRSADSGSNENHVNVMYEVQCYTNDASGKKTACKALFEAVDEVFLNLGFERTSKTNVIQNDATVYRMVGRYQAVVSANNMIYRR